MKNSIKFLLVVCIVLLACTDIKTNQKVDSNNIELDGMWVLKSGKWENGDGTFLKYPDSLTEGTAHIIYSKSHYTVVADAPNMKYFRGEVGEYSIHGNNIISKVIVTNIESNKGLINNWSFQLKDGTIVFKTEGMEEVWEKVE